MQIISLFHWDGPTFVGSFKVAALYYQVCNLLRAEELEVSIFPETWVFK
jgi:hypothetical protein